MSFIMRSLLLVPLAAVALGRPESYGTASSSSPAAAASTVLACPPLGSVLPAPTAPSTDPAVVDAASALLAVLDAAAAELEYTGVSVGVQSIHESETIFEWSYTPPNSDPASTAKVTADTIFRLGSISKVFNVLAVLSAGIDFDDKIVKYVPELLEMQLGEGDEKNAITTVDWERVTIGALASHMSGIATDLVTDLSSIPTSLVDFTQIGLPAVTNETTPGCAGILGLPACTRSEFFRDFGKRHAVHPVFTTPSYSNMGSVILGYAVEAATNTSYDAFLAKAIFEPLGLTTASVFTGPAEANVGFVPVNETWWNQTLGYEDMAGGMYASQRDVMALGAGILKGAVLDSERVRRWMKPAASTSSPGLQLGGPWEILRSDDVTRDGRLIEYYCKSGNMNTYNNILCLVPDYDVVITVLSAGAESSNNFVDIVLTDVVRGLIPAIDDAARAQASALVVGTYASAEVNSTITLTQDDGPGLVVSQWVMKGLDVIQNYAAFSVLSSSAGKAVPSVRVYPTGLQTTTDDSSSKSTSSWRATFDMPVAADFQSKRFWARADCHIWASQDRLVYAFKSMDEFVLEMDGEGKVVSVGVGAWGVTLDREE